MQLTAIEWGQVRRAAKLTNGTVRPRKEVIEALHALQTLVKAIDGRVASNDPSSPK